MAEKLPEKKQESAFGHILKIAGGILAVVVGIELVDSVIHHP